MYGRHCVREQLLETAQAIAQTHILILMHYDRTNARPYLLWRISKTRDAPHKPFLVRKPHVIERKQRAKQRVEQIVLVLAKQKVVLPQSRFIEPPQAVQ